MFATTDIRVQYKENRKEKGMRAKRNDLNQFRFVGKPVVVELAPCDLKRPQARISGLLDAMSGGSQDKLTWRGQLAVQGQTVSIFLPEAAEYSIDNEGTGETKFENTSTYISIDQNGDSELVDIEAFACNRPIRILDTMFLVNDIDIKNKRLVVQQVDAPLSGVVLDRKCPEFEFTTVDGKLVNNKSILGTVTILDIWAVT